MIIVRLQGGLGNQMFQYAAARALALKNGVPLKMDLTVLLDRTPRKNYTFRDYDLGIFKITGEIAKPADLPLLRRKVLPGRLWHFWDKWISRSLSAGRENSFEFSPTFAQLGPGTYLNGFWQSYRYFDFCSDTIRQEFTFRDPLPAEIERNVEAIESHSSLCVHVRRGDFVGNSLHETVSTDYYNRAFRTLAQEGIQPQAFVFSDDIEWCRQNLKLPCPMTFVDPKDAGPKAAYHFAMMQACRFFIIPNSTFSWWAAWLASDPGKIVIAPKHWFSDPSIKTDNLSPDNWLRI